MLADSLEPEFVKSMRKHVAHCLTVGTLALTRTAFAQPASVAPYPACEREPSEGDVAAAQGLFQAGKSSFNEADYGRAITYWEDAYRRDCTAHLLLMNLARAYELNDQKPRAVLALETYQERNPGSAQDEALSKRIQKLREQIPGEAAHPPVAEPVAPAPTTPEPTPQTPPPADTEGPEAKGRRSIVPLIVAGAGGALMIGGGIVWIGALGEVSDIEAECGGTRTCDDAPNASQLQEDGNAARKRANITGAIAGIGLAATAGGILWYFLQDTSPESASSKANGSARWAPQWAPGYVGVGVGGDF